MAGIGKIIGAIVRKSNALEKTVPEIGKTAQKVEKAIFSPELKVFQDKFGSNLLGVRNGVAVAQYKGIPNITLPSTVFAKIGEKGEIQYLKSKSIYRPAGADGINNITITNFKPSKDLQTAREEILHKIYKYGVKQNENLEVWRRHKNNLGIGLRKWLDGSKIANKNFDYTRGKFNFSYYDRNVFKMGKGTRIGLKSGTFTKELGEKIRLNPDYTFSYNPNLDLG